MNQESHLKLSNQLIASDPEYSVWVEASAGTGKTKILTDRVLRLLINEKNPSKILCLTFTKAAAAEMSNRINEELSNWAIVPEEILVERLHNLLGKAPSNKMKLVARRLFASVLDAVDGLKIQTIHAFCQSLLRRFPMEAQISLSYKIIDEAESELLMQAVKSELLTDELLEADISYLAWHLYEASFDELIREIIANMAKISQILQKYNFQVSDIIAALATRLEDSAEVLPDDFSLYVANNILELYPLCPYLSENLQKLLAAKNYEYKAFKDIFLTKENQPRKLITKKLLIQCPTAADIITKWQDIIMAYENRLKNQETLQHTSCFLNIANAFIHKYQKLKSQKYVLDYHDLISVANKLLADSTASSWILYKLDGGIEHILVDEAQDTSLAQWQIIESICAEFFAGDGINKNQRTLFVVGDEKQSIFSFQGADPKNFHAMHQYFKNIAPNFKSIKLDVSFRSSASVLYLVDCLFAPINLLEAISGSSEKIEHKSHRYQEAGKVELWPLVAIETQKNQQPWLLPVSRQIKHEPSDLLAALIASKIASFIKEKRLLPSKGRALQEGDIMILVRRRNEFSENLVKELKMRQLKVAGIDRMKLSQHIAIMDLLALANFILLPEDDLVLACLLKSPLCGMSEEELMALASLREGSLWQHLSSFGMQNKYYLYLKNLQDFAQNTSPFNLFNYVLEVQDGRKKICARLGLEANDALDEFLNLTLTFTQNHIGCLQNFVQFFERTELEIKRDLEHGAKQIRLMTVHAAKGLQSPMVILADTTSLPTDTQNLVFDDLVVWPTKMANLPEHYKLIRAQQNKEAYEEYLRLLYVALTRAEDELIICGYKQQKEISKDCWYSLLKNTMKHIATKSDFLCDENFVSYLQNNEFWLLANQQLVPPKTMPTIRATEEHIDILPEFMTKQAPKEQASLRAVTAASSASRQVDFTSPLVSQQYLERGNLIHKLLEFLPLLQNNSGIVDFVDLYGKNLNDDTKDQILAQYSALLAHEDFVEAHDREIKLEVSIAGMIAKKRVTAKIDRLIIKPNEVIIIDYKSDVSPPTDIAQVKEIYLEQMRTYKNLVAKLYPGKQIRCKLLWTSNAKVLELF